MRISILAVKPWLIAASVLIMVFSLRHFYLFYVAATIDAGSVTSLIAQGRLDQETLSDFTFSEWRAPTEKIGPFTFNNRSYEGCEIVRYRRGSKPHWLVGHVYYEAEYLRPDGKKEIGPVFGPLPYTAPNLSVSISAAAIGLALLTISLFGKRNKGVERTG
jgi:hypothetical protein